ncbi:type II TA system antitoxin MqsA family protein [Desulforegula conservatrix]|uniref:type II TA system antitoxin MqsA family protein n=1 Tax=Desulforegula conservatrix TaxID=153026 RepID=UPI0018DDDC87|nr:type II TA system antitoxin MqsA family protein [Desulforegula conservatrix]
MKNICPVCEKLVHTEKVEEFETFDIKGEKITVPVEYFKCAECGEAFDDPSSEKPDPVEAAYKKYRKIKGMVQPEEITTLRKKYGLTQGELSDLLGLGVATLSRYENGALQNESHDMLLRLSTQPVNLLQLVKRKSESLNDGKRAHLLSTLESELEGSDDFRLYYENHLGAYKPDIQSGFKKLDIQKIYNLILYFCRSGVLKTKLNKLLFYADFKHYKDYAASITGLRYQKLPFGPVPENYGHYFASMQHEEKAVIVEEEIYIHYVGEKFVSVKEPNLKSFTETELQTIEFVKNYFSTFNTTKISDFSHDEKGYKETANSAIIPYSYADDLQI